ncbi:tetratricopeptide repeat protein [Synechocystis sp. PCC 7509]|uniref:tetratricopeptide repeat protein n=1 Tax=Synechocystis sp. PCC 7509 TaxID=927677 RepID=UPI0002ACA0E6|nr:tetratricopeptide repeat protein [Synechocystis sp. PCC 7509]
MQSSLNPSKTHGWLDIVETVSVVGSIGASIASIFINQAALASIPLSITVMLNLVNRKLQLEATSKNSHSAISQLIQADEANSQQITQLQQLTFDYQQVKSNVQEHSQHLQSNQSAISHLLQEQRETQGKLHVINEQLAQSSRDYSQLKSDTQDYVKLPSLCEEQMEVARKVGYLQEIDNSTQAIRIAPCNADAYFKRGLSFQALGNKQGSISDFTEAIQLNPSHASAYYSRGLTHIDLGNRKRAVQDLREAAKLFFEAEDIASYQLAKDSSKQIHELNSSVDAEDSAQVAVGGLFR